MASIKISTLYTLRSKIRHSGRQYRHNNDNSESIFHPKCGLVFAYDIAEVEAALDEYEEQQPNELQPGTGEVVSLGEQVGREARMMLETHSSMAVRDFARGVLAYLALSKQEGRENPLRLLKGDYLEND